MPRIPLKVGAGSTYFDRSAIYHSGSGTDTLIFRYVIQDGDSDTNGVCLAVQVQGDAIMEVLILPREEFIGAAERM